MFGILQKMDRFSNKLMSREENIDFIQEIVDNGMVWEMHNKYIDEALFLMGQGKSLTWFCAVLTKVTQPMGLAFKSAASKPYQKTLEGITHLTQVFVVKG